MKGVTNLRVMHCEGLTSLNGLHMFPSLIEVNLSSNNIMSLAFLENLSQV